MNFRDKIAFYVFTLDFIDNKVPRTPAQIAERAYRYADAMMKARGPENKGITTVSGSFYDMDGIFKPTKSEQILASRKRVTEFKRNYKGTGSLPKGKKR